MCPISPEGYSRPEADIADYHKRCIALSICLTCLTGSEMRAFVMQLLPSIQSTGVSKLVCKQEAELCLFQVVVQHFVYTPMCEVLYIPSHPNPPRNHLC
jgi:hypothetical protein